jgi:hypothetical protein
MNQGKSQQVVFAIATNSYSMPNVPHPDKAEAGGHPSVYTKAGGHPSVYTCILAANQSQGHFTEGNLPARKRKARCSDNGKDTELPNVRSRRSRRRRGAPFPDEANRPAWLTSGEDGPAVRDALERTSTAPCGLTC